jgi:CRP-like cAMP-binding protein
MPTAFDIEIFLAHLKDGGTAKRYKKGEKIFVQGDTAGPVFFIRHGRVQLTVVSGRGREVVIGIFEAKAFFGEASLSGQSKRIATATAMTACSVIRIGKDAMLELLRDKPAFAEGFLAYVLGRNARIEEDLVDQLLNSSEKRLARALLLLTQFGKDGQSEPIPQLSQETLAQIIGTTRGRVSFFMNKFRKLGFIEYNGGLKVHSSLLSVLLRN